MVDGGDRIRIMTWDVEGGIMQLGGTAIGTARCAAFRTGAGRLQAAKNMLERGHPLVPQPVVVWSRLCRV
jgi:6-phosphofructokinase 1